MEASVSTAARMLIFRALSEVEKEMGVRKAPKSFRDFLKRRR